MNAMEEERWILKKREFTVFKKRFSLSSQIYTSFNDLKTRVN